MPEPDETDLALLMRWTAGEIPESDPALQELFERRPDLREDGLTLLGAAAQLDALARTSADDWDLAASETEPGDAALLQGAAERADLETRNPEVQRAPTPWWAWTRSWALVAAAAVVVILGAWQPWKQETVQPRGYLSAPLAEAPVGSVTSFQRFALRDVPERAQVRFVVYDSSGTELAQWQGRGPLWTPTDEERKTMRAAGEIRWEYRVEDPVGGLRSGITEAVLQDSAESD